MVVDTSALLAVLFAEPSASWVAGQLNDHARALRMSTVNLAEALIRIRDRQPHLGQELEDQIMASGIRFVAPDVWQARVAAEARLAYPLNLGDCFAYALAKAEGCSILAVDGDFRRTDCPVVMPPDQR